MILCEGYTDIEALLYSYRDLTERISGLVKEAEKEESVLGIVLSMGPSMNMVQDITSPKVKRSEPAPWLNELQRRIDRAQVGQSEHVSLNTEEALRCREEQEKIIMLVDRSGLTQKERLCIERKYFFGYEVMAVADALGQVSRSTVQRITRKALAKIRFAADQDKLTDGDRQ